MPQFRRYGKKMFGHHTRPSAVPLGFRTLKVYPRHTQENAVDFINYVVDKLPFRIKAVRTENRHEFQAKSNWHVQGLGMSASNRRHYALMVRWNRQESQTARLTG